MCDMAQWLRITNRFGLNVLEAGWTFTRTTERLGALG